ncbi:hypothetical protein WALSEDRAFT_58778 [Wallemia mellicola CBS 633.66]|uniref:Zn(2)-C6 fungal-type domain-containing protein n=1 Tax=Wallemia mellicola (strain ATCC MYA-4683 / CBS 633.66) TaxID=671144 RepID=I4Y642_WALMC|nr:hypothetical protein WALSEDRAFT_58778 [Wallemia mellicola CBS 633.66]EIM19434.1 hypothetical protein WALSEDRAFT_58778 [Wallemia mellicola CBS 633.66]TIB86769.1 hypothetical protein E3Q19_03824 [Wallemia mellicola]TIC00415.1 hypothetical protein E3Q16_04004 [Wallemia mellicola]|eukprot:XP_006960584.1 hypothetical protein WALSEDRAFT_58778 [Wallemia mellicola CBS 633.66]
MEDSDNKRNKMDNEKKPTRSTKACLECRSMKSRCNGDGTNTCERCLKRGVACVYEQTVRRRGKDKRPRIVTRRNKSKSKSDSFDEPVTKRPRTSLSTSTSSSFDEQQYTHSPQSSTPVLSTAARPPLTSHSRQHSNDLFNSVTTPAFLSPNTQFAHFTQFAPPSPQFLISPNTSYERETFWDLLVNDRCNVNQSKDRTKVNKSISDDLWLVFSRCDFIATLFNISNFFDNINDSARRVNVEPSLIHSLLAISHALQGQFQIAYVMADRAHSTLRSAMMTGRLTVGIAQSAVVGSAFCDCTQTDLTQVLQYYESFPLGTFNIKRLAAPLYAADAVIKNLALTCLDADKVAHVFDDDGIPISTTEQEVINFNDMHLQPPLHSTEDSSTCPCQSWAQPSHVTRKDDAIRFRHIPKFATENVSESHIHQEEIRRVVWGTVNNGWYLQMLDPHAVATLHTSQSSNYGVFYTAESFVLSLPEEGLRRWSRYTLWAFVDRLKLLCHAATRLSRSLPPLELHMRANKISAEVDKIERDLANLHSCNRGVHGWHVSNVAFITRLILTAKTRQFSHPDGTNTGPSDYYTRQRAREWLDAHSLIWDHIINKQSIANQPMIFVALICQALRCLDLVALDSAFTRAIHVARNILKGIEEMIAIYPTSESSDLDKMMTKVKVSCDELEKRTILAQCQPNDSIILQNIQYIKNEQS